MSANYKLKKLNASREYIADQYSAPLSLAIIAEQSNMSPYHFLRTFKSVYGETPNEFMIRLRIEDAKNMLITEAHSISEICEKVGYASLGSFSSLFVKHVGMAPTEYRRKLWALSSEPYRFPLQAIPACYAYRFAKKLAI